MTNASSNSSSRFHVTCISHFYTLLRRLYREYLHNTTRYRQSAFNARANTISYTRSACQWYKQT